MEKNWWDGLARYRKTLVALAGFVLTALNIMYGTDSRVQALISLATAFGVYSVPNTTNKVSK